MEAAGQDGRVGVRVVQQRAPHVLIGGQHPVHPALKHAPPPPSAGAGSRDKLAKAPHVKRHDARLEAAKRVVAIVVELAAPPAARADARFADGDEGALGLHALQLLPQPASAVDAVDVRVEHDDRLVAVAGRHDEIELELEHRIPVAVVRLVTRPLVGKCGPRRRMRPVARPAGQAAAQPADHGRRIGGAVGDDQDVADGFARAEDGRKLPLRLRAGGEEEHHERVGCGCGAGPRGEARRAGR
eukprot:1531584-Prymnesium_polylepis.1